MKSEKEPIQIKEQSPMGPSSPDIAAVVIENSRQNDL
jgi:hypothetical protein